jgi:rhodanese-related sulfurtransferase
MSDGKEQGRIRISVEEAKKLYDEGNVTVLDVIDTGTFEKIPYKVKDAVRIAPEDFKEEYSKLPKDRHVLAYCT